MSWGHPSGPGHLHVAGTSPVHRVAPHAKLVGLLTFVVTVALTPRQWVVAFAIDAAVLLLVVRAARVPLLNVVARLAVILPFVAVAVLLPFIGDGEQVRVAGLELSVDGLWASWNIVAKATLGATASIAVTATTPLPDLLGGLTRLRLPAVVVGIVAFMLRYLDLVADQLARMRRAMTARGHDPRWLWQARPIAASAGTLFVRTYERGERVHDAMTARGYTGTLPSLGDEPATHRDWILGLLPTVVALGAAASAALT